MADDGHTRPAAHAGLGALNSLARVGERPLIGALRYPHALDAHRIAGGVHHDEHVFQPAILLADEFTDGAAVIAIGEHAGRAAMDAELVLDGHAMHIVALSHGAVVIDQKLRHHE